MASAATRLRIAVSAQGQTIEDVYATHAPEDSHGSEAFERQHGPSWTLAAQAIALQPLDAEACLAEGVDPHDLYERSLEDCREHSVAARGHVGDVRAPAVSAHAPSKGTRSALISLLQQATSRVDPASSLPLGLQLARADVLGAKVSKV